VELDGPHRPPDQREQHVGDPVAARDVTADEPAREHQRHAVRAEEEQDTDWTLVGTLNSVLANTKVNTLKFSYTHEDVFFGNPGYFETGDQRLLKPLLSTIWIADSMPYVIWITTNNGPKEDVKQQIWSLTTAGGQLIYSAMRHRLRARQSFS